ncbi:NRDE family protein [Thalassotalea piscium]|uniref:Uncharacterized protein with NRDE domain n=1 Tax=Thalassotalea piscium TaxID=1230533 RepID=A0A7X0TS99_9GAMM|nr:NRDE family protein [Thalassotalea piscium]MBB6541889.1 uncharacterized protein with NRDE domain [Thalassotalea piscium]
MCILFISINEHPIYPLIVCANRDEFHQRPTQAMHWWQDTSMLAGKDLQAGGTWFGVNAQKQFAALTNYRLPNKFDSSKKSRGNLVINALTPNLVSQNPKEMQIALQKSSSNYNGFNLLRGDETHLHCFDSTTQQFTVLNNGTFSLCNGALNDIWPKMKFGKQKLEKLVSAHGKLNIDELFLLMQNNTQADFKQLPNTGISTTWEQLLSSIFIVSPEYGTRSTTIFLKDKCGRCHVVERSFNAYGVTSNQVEFSF